MGSKLKAFCLSIIRSLGYLEFLSFLNGDTLNKNSNASLYLKEQKLKQLERERRNRDKDDYERGRERK
jgi:hypothetical protein